MRKKIELFGLVMVLVCGLMVSLNGPAGATTGTSHGWKFVSGVGLPLPDESNDCYRSADRMPGKFKDYFSIPAMVMTGDLEGCWYTKVDPHSVIDFPNGWHFERGWEVFFEHNRSWSRFETTYTFQGRYDSSGNEIEGQCQHPIIHGSGRGRLSGAAGQLFFVDEFTPVTRFPYLGYLKLS